MTPTPPPASAPGPHLDPAALLASFVADPAQDPADDDAPVMLTYVDAGGIRTGFYAGKDFRSLTEAVQVWADAVGAGEVAPAAPGGDVQVRRVVAWQVGEGEMAPASTAPWGCLRVPGAGWAAESLARWFAAVRAAEAVVATAWAGTALDGAVRLLVDDREGPRVRAVVATRGGGRGGRTFARSAAAAAALILSAEDYLLAHGYVGEPGAEARLAAAARAALEVPA